jgi:hypothetical protein
MSIGTPSTLALAICSRGKPPVLPAVVDEGESAEVPGTGAANISSNHSESTSQGAGRQRRTAYAPDKVVERPLSKGVTVASTNGIANRPLRRGFGDDAFFRDGEEGA